MSAPSAAFERPRPGASNTVCFVLEAAEIMLTFFVEKN